MKGIERMAARTPKKKRRLKGTSETEQKKVSNVVPAKIGPEMPQVALPLSFPIDRLLGNYSNLAVISHTEREFVFDFALAVRNQSVLASRVITSPHHAKKVFEALGTNIKRYEETFGEIKDK